MEEATYKKAIDSINLNEITKDEQKALTDILIVYRGLDLKLCDYCKLYHKFVNDVDGKDYCGTCAPVGLFARNHGGNNNVKWITCANCPKKRYRSIDLKKRLVVKIDYRLLCCECISRYPEYKIFPEIIDENEYGIPILNVDWYNHTIGANFHKIRNVDYSDLIVYNLDKRRCSADHKSFCEKLFYMKTRFNRSENLYRLFATNEEYGKYINIRYLKIDSDDLYTIYWKIMYLYYVMRKCSPLMPRPIYDIVIRNFLK